MLPSSYFGTCYFYYLALRPPSSGNPKRGFGLSLFRAKAEVILGTRMVGIPRCDKEPSKCGHFVNYMYFVANATRVVVSASQS